MISERPNHCTTARLMIIVSLAVTNSAQIVRRNVLRHIWLSGPNSAQIISSATKYDQQKTSLIPETHAPRCYQTTPSIVCGRLRPPTAAEHSSAWYDAPRAARNVSPPSPPVTARASQPQRTRLCNAEPA